VTDAAAAGGAGALAAIPGHLLRRCQQISVALFLQEVDGLTPVQFAVLAALDSVGNEPVDQNRLGGLVALDRTTVSLTVGKLAARGLVDKRPAAADRRARHIALTAAGWDALAAALPRVRAVQDRLLAPLDDAERHQLAALLARVADAGNAASRAPLLT
jgi:DNA-binding MarR family transcriptional regulator